MNDVQNELRRSSRLFRRLVGCVGLFLVFVVDCCGNRVALGAAPEESYIAVRKPRALPPRISAERIPLGISGDYKPSLALLPEGDLLLVMFNQVDKGEGKVREEMIHFRSADGGKTWGERQVRPLLGREPYFSVLRDGTLFLTTHLSSRDVLNPDGYVHSYVHRSADSGKTWSTLRIGSEDVPGVAEKTWTHTSRNVLELQDGTVILGVSAGSSTDYLWRSKDKGQTWDKSLVCTVEGFDVKKQGFPWHAETVFWQAGNGDILAIARCHSGALPALGNTEIPEGNDNVERMALFRSRNGGGTWTLEPEMGNDYAEHYQAILRLQDKRLLFTFTVRALRPPLGLQAVLGTETANGFKFDFRSDRLVLDEKTPADKSSGGGFGNTVQLPNGQLVSAYTYRGEDGNVHAEVLRWALP
ncbi:MAG: sialidase family protein [Planctomycetota bacterium]|nr:sialidase family protein [Planctomycetota bacterium]